MRIRRAPREAGERHKVYIQGQTPPGTWQDLAEFQEHLPDAYHAVPADMRDNYAGGDGVMLQAFARSILDDTRPPVDVYDAVNMTAPGILSELSAQRGGEPVEVPDFRAGKDG